MSILSLKESSEGTTLSNDCRLETLMVDNDEEFHLPDARILLESCNFDATICQNVKESVDLVQENSRPNFDVAIVEVSMLGTDGFEALKYTLSERNIPFVRMTSTNLDKEFIIKHRNEYGALDFIPKPLTEENLKELYRRICQLSNTKMNMDSEAAAADTSAIDAAEQKEQPPRKKPRVVWTDELHAKFVLAVEKLGDKAVPKKILEEMKQNKQMGEPNLTRENVASHLQKYRQTVKKEEKAERQTQHISQPHHNPNSLNHHHPVRQQLPIPAMTDIRQITTASNNHYTHNNNNNVSTTKPIVRSPTPIQILEPPLALSQAQQPPMMKNSWDKGMTRALLGGANNNLDAGGFERMRRLTESNNFVTQNPSVAVPHMCLRSSFLNHQPQACHDLILDSTSSRSQMTTPMEYCGSDNTTPIPTGGFFPYDANYNQFWSNNFMCQPPRYHPNDINGFRYSTSAALDQQPMMFLPHQSSLRYNSNPSSSQMMGTRSVNMSYIMPHHAPTESLQDNSLVNPQPPVAHQTYTDDHLQSAHNNLSILPPQRDHTNISVDQYYLNEESREANLEQLSNQSWIRSVGAHPKVWWC